jgi:hypothetical protein
MIIESALAGVLAAKGQTWAALDLCLRSFAGIEAMFGPEHPLTLREAESLHYLSTTTGRYAGTVRAITLLVAVERKKAPQDEECLGRLLIVLGFAHQEDLRSAEAEVALTEGIAALRSARDRPSADADRIDLQAAEALSALGVARSRQGKHREAEESARAAVTLVREVAKRREGDQRIPGFLARALASLGEALLDQRKFTEAEPVARECLVLREAAVPDHWRRYLAQSLLGASLAGQGKHAEAEPLLLEAVRELAGQGAPSRTRARVLRRVVDLYEAWGRPGAVAAANEVGRVQALMESAEARFRERDYPKAEADARAAAAILREVARGGAGDPVLLDIELSCALGWTGQSLLSQGRHADAEAVLRECLALRRERMPEHQRSYVVQSFLGGSLAGQRKFAEAEPLLVEAARKLAEQNAATETQAEARQRIADLYEAWGRPEQAAEWRAPVPTAR